MLLTNYYTTILVNSLIEVYHGDARCLLLFTDGDLDFKTSVPSIRIKLTNDSHFNDQLVFNFYGCQSVVVHSSDVTGFLEAFETRIRLRMERFNSRKYLVIPRDPDEDLEERFFKRPELEFVCNLLLVVAQKQPRTYTYGLKNSDTLKMVFDLKTHSYVGAARNQEAVLLDRWFSTNQTFLFGRNLYLDKLSNQMGRPLRMATFTYEPYSVIGASVKDHQGSEMMTAIHFATKYNMTPIPVINEEDYWGEIFPDWSGNGLLGNLVQDNADVGFSALYTWEICYHYLDLSKPLVRTGITCLVPAPKLAARWLTPLLTYSPQVWVCVILSCLVGVTLLSTILYCYDTFSHQYSKDGFVYYLQTSTLVVTKPLMAQPLTISQVPKQKGSKLILVFILLASLFLTSIYGSGLASVMTLPRYENAINTVEDFVRSDLDWGATQDAWITSIQSAEEPIYVEIVSRFHPTPEDELRDLSKTGKFAFSLERLPSDNFAIGSYIQEDVISDFHLMQEDFYWEQCVIMLRKNSVLLPALDLFILKVFEAGLISKWQNKAVERYMDVKIQRIVLYYTHHVQEHEVVRLRWSHVEGIFAILLFGYGMGCVIFVIEVMVHRKIYFLN